MMNPPPSSASNLPSAEALLAAIIESSDDAIVSKSLTGIVTSWNAGAQRIFGYEAGEMIGQPIARLIPAGTRAGGAGDSAASAAGRAGGPF